MQVVAEADGESEATDAVDEVVEPTGDQLTLLWQKYHELDAADEVPRERGNLGFGLLIAQRVVIGRRHINKQKSNLLRADVEYIAFQAQRETLSRIRRRHVEF